MTLFRAHADSVNKRRLRLLDRKASRTHELRGWETGPFGDLFAIGECGRRLWDGHLDKDRLGRLVHDDDATCKGCLRVRAKRARVEREARV